MNKIYFVFALVFAHGHAYAACGPESAEIDAKQAAEHVTQTIGKMRVAGFTLEEDDREQLQHDLKILNRVQNAALKLVTDKAGVSHDDENVSLFAKYTADSYGMVSSMVASIIRIAAGEASDSDELMKILTDGAEKVKVDGAKLLALTPDVMAATLVKFEMQIANEYCAEEN